RNKIYGKVNPFKKRYNFFRNGFVRGIFCFKRFFILGFKITFGKNGKGLKKHGIKFLPKRLNLWFLTCLARVFAAKTLKFKVSLACTLFGNFKLKLI
ncbi:hypothetical protein GGTG_04804, partial [Gaeumannomyces tritici R3-111a-1]